MSQFNFYNKQKKPHNFANVELNATPSNHSSSQQSPDDIRKGILESYDKYYNLQTSHPEIKELYLKKTQVSNDILVRMKVMQSNQVSSEVASVLNEELAGLDRDYEKLNETYNERIATELKWLKNNYPDIYDRMVNSTEPLDRTTLENVLGAFVQSRSGVVTEREAVNQGLDFMQQRHNLPSDFFDRSKIDQFIQTGGEPLPL